jgi:hypothetical protein
MFTRLTFILPPASQPAPKRSVIISDRKQIDIIPCTTMSGKPHLIAASLSLW